MRCACGAAPTANGRECQSCWLKRVRSVSMHYAPTRDKGGIDPTKQKKWDANLEAYAKERKAGSQPASTQRRDVETAKRMSDATGSPYRTPGT